MKTFAAVTAIGASLLVAVGLAGPVIGADTHYTVHCADASATSGVARAYDRSVIERAGGKAHAIELFKQAHPGGVCWLTGPHPNLR
jgi:hypothetical protein